MLLETAAVRSTACEAGIQAIRGLLLGRRRKRVELPECRIREGSHKIVMGTVGKHDVEEPVDELFAGVYQRWRCSAIRL
jgi:hypothetical protein